MLGCRKRLPQRKALVAKRRVVLTRTSHVSAGCRRRLAPLEEGALLRQDLMVLAANPVPDALLTTKRAARFGRAILDVQLCRRHGSELGGGEAIPHCPA